MDISMETTYTTIKPQDFRNPSPISSPKSNGSISSNLDRPAQQQNQTHVCITRSDHLSNPYPTTFVQADTSTFKHVVQMLTGSSETAAKQASSQDAPTTPPASAKGSFVIPPIKKQSSFKLYERRLNNNNNSMIKNNLMINTLRINGPRFSANNHSPRFSPRNAEILLSPSMLDFPKLALNSPVTPLNNEDPFRKSSPLSLGNSSSSSLEEERGIAEKGFYFHPSPIPTPRDSEPQLLPLFPVTSPKLSSGSSS